MKKSTRKRLHELGLFAYGPLFFRLCFSAITNPLIWFGLLLLVVVIMSLTMIGTNEMVQLDMPKP